MATHRSFAKRIVLADDFMQLPISAQLLYYTIGVMAYDKGIVINAKTTARMIGSNNEDVETLCNHHYLEPIEDGHYRIVHWNENNGIGENAAARANTDYKKWREDVLERDSYRCQICGSRNDLEAHHIKPFAQYPDLRTNLNNGMTLCKSCHRELHRATRGGDSNGEK